MSRQLSKTLFATLVCLVVATSARAAVVDLISGNSGTVNGAMFEWNAQVLAGTGVFDTFVRLQSKGNATSEQGYNTSGRNGPGAIVVFGEDNSPHTHDLRLKDLVKVTVDGVDYYQFLLDINESNSFDSVLSLDKIQIYTSPTASQTTTNVASLGLLQYDLDAGEDSQILLDHKRAPGSGRSDMGMLVPVSFFADAGANDYVYLYSAFGYKGLVGSGPNKKDYGTSAGFEEWGAKTLKTPDVTTEIPTPAALPAGLALAGALLARRRRAA